MFFIIIFGSNGAAKNIPIPHPQMLVMVNVNWNALGFRGKAFKKWNLILTKQAMIFRNCTVYFSEQIQVCTHIILHPPPNPLHTHTIISSASIHPFHTIHTCSKTPLWASTLGHGFLALPCSSRMSGTTLYSCDTSLNMGSLGRCFSANSRWHVYRGSVLRSTAWP